MAASAAAQTKASPTVRAFRVTTPDGHSIVFRAKSSSDALAWMAALLYACELRDEQGTDAAARAQAGITVTTSVGMEVLAEGPTKVPALAEQPARAASCTRTRTQR